MSSLGKTDVWPFYVVCDVSSSMWAGRRRPTPHDAMALSLPDIIFEIEESPTASDIARICVVAFHDVVEELLPLTQVAGERLLIPELPRGGGTNFAATFAWLAEHVPYDYRRLSAKYHVKRPAVYFITDGYAQVDGQVQPESEWGPPLARLKRDSCRVIITALGLGDAQPKNLCAVRQSPGAAWIAEDAAAPAHLLGAIIQRIILSVVQSSGADDFSFDAPPGMSRVSC